MDDAAGDSRLFDVAAEEKRITGSLLELYNKGLLSPTAARKARENLRKWYRTNKHLQIGTTT